MLIKWTQCLRQHRLLYPMLRLFTETPVKCTINKLVADISTDMKPALKPIITPTTKPSPSGQTTASDRILRIYPEFSEKICYQDARSAF